MLALVFVQSLNLNVKERIGWDIDTALGSDHESEVDLVGSFDRHEFLLESRISGEFLECVKSVEIRSPVGIAKSFCEQLGQARIALKHPATRSDAIGLVLNLARLECVELRE